VRERSDVLAAWVVTLLVVAFGLLLLLFHEPGAGDRVVPWRYAPPVAGAEPGDDDGSAPHGIDWGLPQSGSSTAPDTLPKRQ